MIELHVFLFVYGIFVIGTSTGMVGSGKRAKREADLASNSKKDEAPSSMYFDYLLPSFIDYVC